ncbi:MAG: hypothetical protein WD273_13750 [Trueperaceae bacterium]
MEARAQESSIQILVTWLSGLLLLTIVVYLVWEGTRPPLPASFTFAIETVHEANDYFHLRLSVANEGGESVQDLGVTLELYDGEELLETVSSVLDWLPERSTRELVLILEQDPSLYRTMVRFGGYQIP